MKIGRGEWRQILHRLSAHGVMALRQASLNTYWTITKDDYPLRNLRLNSSKVNTKLCTAPEQIRTIEKPKTSLNFRSKRELVLLIYDIDFLQNRPIKRRNVTCLCYIFMIYLYQALTSRNCMSWIWLGAKKFKSWIISLHGKYFEKLLYSSCKYKIS